jgi:hypothetical protein
MAEVLIIYFLIIITLLLAHICDLLRQIKDK